MSVEDNIIKFNPRGDDSSSIFGLPSPLEEARVVVVPVPWDVTSTSHGGLVDGPQTLIDASPLVPLWDEEHGDIWKMGIAMLDIPEDLYDESQRLRPLAQLALQFQEGGDDDRSDEFLKSQLDHINEQCSKMVTAVRESTSRFVSAGQKVIVVGGDNSTGLGLLQALAAREESFGILHIDAHKNLQISPDGFDHSPSAAIHNALEIEKVEKVVQVGIRNFTEEESERYRTDKERLTAYTDRYLKKAQFEGHTWDHLCTDILDSLPDRIYLSLDLDGLCPEEAGHAHPGGLTYSQTAYLIDQLHERGLEVIGADLTGITRKYQSTAGSLAAHLLYRICNLFREEGQLY